MLLFLVPAAVNKRTREFIANCLWRLVLRNFDVLIWSFGQTHIHFGYIYHVVFFVSCKDKEWERKWWIWDHRIRRWVLCFHLEETKFKVAVHKVSRRFPTLYTDWTESPCFYIINCHCFPWYESGTLKHRRNRKKTVKTDRFTNIWQKILQTCFNSFLRIRRPNN